MMVGKEDGGIIQSSTTYFITFEESSAGSDMRLLLGLLEANKLKYEWWGTPGAEHGACKQSPGQSLHSPCPL